MSQYSNNKGKDTAGKKYASFNLSQNFRTSKGDNKNVQGKWSYYFDSLKNFLKTVV